MLETVAVLWIRHMGVLDQDKDAVGSVTMSLHLGSGE
jgi:hypothetical protein